MKRFELSTLSLARRCSTTELHPHAAIGRSKNPTTLSSQTGAQAKPRAGSEVEDDPLAPAAQAQHQQGTGQQVPNEDRQLLA